jgi:hypothetical protein
VEIFKYVFEIPAQTDEASPLEEEMEIEGEVLERIEIYAPWGHGGLAKMAIFFGPRQLAPRPATKWIEGNDAWFRWKLEWPVPGKKAALRLVGWNEDDSYDHSFYIYAHVGPRPRMPQWVRDLVERLFFRVT